MAGPPTPPIVPTPTGYTLLGLLSFGRELSGYELKQWSENLRFFWAAPAMSQVYREVQRLAVAGFVAQRPVVRDGTRETTVYSLTARGEAAVRAWLAELPEPPVLKHPVALRVFFGHLLAPADLRRAIEAHRAWCDRVLAELEEVRAGLEADRDFHNAALVSDWGMTYLKGERAAVDGLEDAVTTARTTDGPAAAPAAPPGATAGTDERVG